MPGGQDKTEKATPRKLRKARQKGQVALSSSFTSSLMLLAGAGILLVCADAVGTAFMDITADAAHTAASQPESAQVMAALGRAFMRVAGPVLAMLLATCAIAGLASFAQVGPLLAFDPLVPRLSRLNPATGLKNRIFSARAVVELLKSIMILIIVAAALFVIIKPRIPLIVTMSRAAPEEIAPTAVSMISSILLVTAGCYIAVGLADLVFQRWQFARDQRMTKEEVKREHKDQEGDPQARAARKRLHHEILAQNMVAQTRNADVVVVNPTHIACALAYDPAKGDRAPRLVARGADALASAMRQAADEEGIPIKRDVPLARLLHELEVDVEIPPDLYEAVAVVLQWVAAQAAVLGTTPRWLQADECND